MEHACHARRGELRHGVEKMWSLLSGRRSCSRHSDTDLICFSHMRDALEFVLENTYLRMHDGKLLKQVIGIPMGDSLSPAIAVGTLAYMEMEWMSQLDPSIKQRFRAGRFMDDILMVYQKNGWDSRAFVQNFEV